VVPWAPHWAQMPGWFWWGPIEHLIAVVAIPFYERSNEAVAVLERNESLVLGGGSGSFSVAKTPQDPIAENLDQGAAPWIDQQHRVDLTTQSPHQGIMNRHRKCVCMWRYDSSITLFDVNPIQFMGNRNQVLLPDIDGKLRGPIDQ